MNPKWIATGVVALAVGALAFGFTRGVVCKGSGASLDCLQDVTFMTHELKLSDAQAAEIKALHSTLGAKLNDCCTRHCAARARLGQALADGTNGSVQADAVVADMCRAYEESERATLDHLRQVRAILNAEQRGRFDAMIADCLCGPCSMPGGGMKATGKNPMHE